MFKNSCLLQTHFSILISRSVDFLRMAKITKVLFTFIVVLSLVINIFAGNIGELAKSSETFSKIVLIFSLFLFFSLKFHFSGIASNSLRQFVDFI